MNKERISKSKRIRIIKIIIFVIAGAGLIFMLYPSIVNAIVGAKQADVLSEWEAQKEDLSGEVTEDAASTESPGTAAGDIIEEEGASSTDTTGQPGSSNVISADTGKETIDYNSLTAEDFFPLKMSIPRIELEQISYEGADTQTLKQGPGHIEETPLPGDNGRCTISGHRTTYGAPFRKIDDLEEGDLIYLETTNGELFTYVVTGTEIVNPKDVYILDGSYKKELLLTTCEPEYSSVKRLVVIAELVNLYPLELASAGGK
ncbi:MAG: class E sortase [Actinomycetota bacterium]